MTAPSAAVARPAPHHTPGRYHTGARNIPRLVLYAWAALFLNVLAPGGESLLPLPHFAMQAVAQGSLLVAVLFALLANPRLALRPNLLLVLLSVLALTSFIVSLHNEFIVGSVYRGFRLLTFVACALAAVAVVGPTRHGAATGPPASASGSCWSASSSVPCSHPAWRSRSADGCRGRCGRCRPRRWLTTQP